jgi:hypothetical protein
VQKVYLVGSRLATLKSADLICNWNNDQISDLSVGDECHDMGYVIQDVSERYVKFDLSDEVTRHEHYIWTCYEQWMSMKGDLEDCSCKAGTGCKK